MPSDIERSEEFRFVTGPVRPGSHPVQVFNEGLVIFYYDASRLERVRSLGPTILFEDLYADESEG